MDIKQISFKATIVLGSVELPFDLFYQLEPGDVLILDQLLDAPLSMHLGDEKRFLGWPGLHEGRKAVKIEKTL